MKRRTGLKFTAAALAAAVTVGLFPATALADTSPEPSNVVLSGLSAKNKWVHYKNGLQISFSEAWTIYLANKEKFALGSGFGSKGGVIFSFQGNGSIPVSESAYVFDVRSADINVPYNNTLDLYGAITVDNGCDLRLATGNSYCDSSFNFFAPVTVQEGSLTFKVEVNRGKDEYCFMNDTAVIEVKPEGNLIIGSSAIIKSETGASPIQVQGGTVTVEHSKINSNSSDVYYDAPEITAAGAPAILVTSGTLQVTGGEISSTGDAPAILVEEGGTATVTADSVVTAGKEGVPAIQVESGGTLEVTPAEQQMPDENSEKGFADVTVEPTVSAAGGNDAVAVELAASAVLKKGDVTVTTPAASESAGPVAAMDNAGNLILPASTVIRRNESDGLTTTAPAVVTNGGLIVQGTASQAPAVDADTGKVTVPSGGSVITEQNGVLVSETLTYGGSVTENAGESLVVRNSAPVILPPDTVVTPSNPSAGETGKPEKPGETEQPAKPGQAEEPGESAALPFADTAQGAWYYEAVRYVYERGMMNGTGNTAFSPNDAVTRGMTVAILHRLEGSPAAGTARFTDVAEDRYYAAGAAWASANGIAAGYGDSRFGPEDAVTREQLAVILYRYARLKGFDVTAAGSLAVFSDGAAVSGYAADAMAWAVGCGLISGMGDGTLAPQGGATRAQTATILMNFCEKFGL